MPLKRVDQCLESVIDEFEEAKELAAAFAPWANNYEW